MLACQENLTNLLGGGQEILTKNSALQAGLVKKP
jgi:hypothetical protein